jgi:UDP-galactopyranose mutase
MAQYDYLIVGSGLFGAVFAHEATKKGKKCLVIDKRNHAGGNVFCEKIEDINVHKYGAHIFHTNDKAIWDYVNQFVEFNRYTNSPVAFYKDEVYNLPFNMNTFHQLWGVKTPEEAKAKIEEQVKASGITNPQNLEEQAISLVGIDIYEKLIKGPKSNGDVKLQNYLHLLLSVYQYDLPMTIIILMINTKESQLEDITS